MPLVVGCAAGLATVLGVFEYTGGRFDGYFNRSEEDEFERKTRLRENRRRPIEETIRDVGEGRGRFLRHYSYGRPDRRLDKLTLLQVSALLGMKRGGERGSRRSTASRSIPSKRQLIKTRTTFLHQSSHFVNITVPGRCKGSLRLFSRQFEFSCSPRPKVPPHGAYEHAGADFSEVCSLPIFIPSSPWPWALIPSPECMMRS